MYLLAVYIPDTHLEPVKNALFSAGAGRVGLYDRCSWQCEGVGQYRPLPGSQPYIGEDLTIETVKEWKVEVIFTDDLLQEVVQAMKQAHPYEVPAYQVLKMCDV